MDTELLRTFIEVSKARHFGRASENLYLTQSAVSFRIRQLETLLGVPLFTRQRNNISLTPAGERLLPYAKSMLASWQMALQDVGSSTLFSSQLSLGATPNLWDCYLSRCLTEICQQHPDLALRTEANSQVSLVRHLLEGLVDIAVLFEPPKTGDVSSQPVGSISLQLVSSTANTKLEQLQQQGYVLIDWGTGFNLQQARLLDRNIAPVLHTGQSQIALNFLLSQGGAAFLPVSLIETALSTGQLHPVDQVPTMEGVIYAVYRNDAERLDIIQPLVATLAAANAAASDKLAE